MPFAYIKDNLLNTKRPVLVHGCNAQGTMGAGVAKQVAKKWPKITEGYSSFCRGEADYVLGRNYLYHVNNKLVVVNAVTQEFYGRDGGRYVSYDALDSCMELVAQKFRPLDKIAMPRIGAGFGGGEWKVIAQIIRHRLKDFDVLIYDFKAKG